MLVNMTLLFISYGFSLKRFENVKKMSEMNERVGTTYSLRLKANFINRNVKKRGEIKITKAEICD